MHRPFALRMRLVLVVVVLVGAALLVSGVAATSLLSSYLLGQVDRQLVDVASAPQGPAGGGAQPGGALPGGGGPPTGIRPALPSDFYLQTSAADGTVLSTSGSAFAASTPALPTLTRIQVLARSEQPFTVGSTSGDTRWRVVVTPTASGSATVARSLDDVDATETRLAALMGAIGLVVLVLAGIAAYFLVRRSFRPLVAVEEAAAAIAAGDLSRRVPQEDPRSEVGKMSAALNAMLSRLEGAFRDREAALARSRESEETMRAFVADASHELRTPLTAVAGYAELYRAGGVQPADVPATFDRIEGEADRMGALVDDLLLLARLDQQRGLEQIPVDLVTLLSDRRAAILAAEPSTRIAIVAEGEAPVVLGDAARLGQVFSNVFSNAVRYGGDDVQVRVRTQSQSAVVDVVDHGPGIPDEDKPHIFARFYRSDSARSRTSGGTGLGLSIAAAIVEAHGGRIRVADTPGGGATFSVELPLAPQSPAAT